MSYGLWDKHLVSTNNKCIETWVSNAGHIVNSCEQTLLGNDFWKHISKNDTQIIVETCLLPFVIKYKNKTETKKIVFF